MSNDKVVLVRSLKPSLDAADGGYGMIEANKVVEMDKHKAKDLVERGVFEFVNTKEDTNYFTRVENVPERKVESFEKPEVKAEDKNARPEANLKVDDKHEDVKFENDSKSNVKVDSDAKVEDHKTSEKIKDKQVDAEKPAKEDVKKK